MLLRKGHKKEDFFCFSIKGIGLNPHGGMGLALFKNA
jgi:hypothetical protein